MMRERKSLADLITETPKLITDLARAEIAHLKSEVSSKVAGLGLGAGLLAGAAFFGIFLFGWLLVAAFEGLNEAFEPWLSALIVAAFLLVVTLILALIGLAEVKKHKDFKNLETVDSIKDDVNVVRGLGHAADGTSPLEDLPAVTDQNGVRP